MGLLGNGFRHNLTGRIGTASTSLDGCNASTIPASLNLTAFRRNMLVGGITSAQASVPSGKRHPNVWLMPREGGAVSSFRRAGLRIDGAAVGEMGLARGGVATLRIDGTATAGLIIGATGSATLRIDGAAAIVASLNATGAATITIDGAAVLGAIASLSGEATLTIDGHGAVMGVGQVTGTTADTGALTPAGIAAAVWAALAAQNNGAGTMGARLNAAAVGGVDLDALAQAVWEHATRTLTAGAAPSAGTVATAVLATLQATAIPVNTVQIKGQTIAGAGTEADPWGP